MTKLLEQAIARARELSEADQDAIGQLVLDEIESERHWDELFAKSPEKLKKLADQALAEHEAEESRPHHPEKLSS
jgi:hypothetical protein